MDNICQQQNTAAYSWICNTCSRMASSLAMSISIEVMLRSIGFFQLKEKKMNVEVEVILEFRGWGGSWRGYPPPIEMKKGTPPLPQKSPKMGFLIKCLCPLQIRNFAKKVTPLSHAKTIGQARVWLEQLFEIFQNSRVRYIESESILN